MTGRDASAARRPAPRAGRGVRALLVASALAVVALFLVAPLAVVLFEAFRGGLAAWTAAVTSPDALAALRLTLLVVAIVVPLNACFGLAAAWALGKFRFAGRSVVLALVDLPFSVSPVVAGMLFVLLFGRSGLLGPWLSRLGVDVIFATPGVVLATLFVTFPFVARELVPLMESTGTEEEEAARLLGAGFFTTFLRVTLPNVKGALLYGVLLATARAVGEFGAVSVVSGQIRGRTNTLPLEIEALHAELSFQPAFAVASLLLVTAIVTLVARALVERGEARGRRTEGAA